MAFIPLNAFPGPSLWREPWLVFVEMGSEIYLNYRVGCSGACRCPRGSAALSRVTVPALPVDLMPSPPSLPPLSPHFLHPLCPGLLRLPLLLALGYPDSSMHPRFSVLSLAWGSRGFEGAYSVGVRVPVQEGKICLRSKCTVWAQSPGRVPQDSFCFSFQFALGWCLLASPGHAGGISVS